MTSGSDWTVQTVGRSADEKPGSPFWSLAVAAQDSGENQLYTGYIPSSFVNRFSHHDLKTFIDRYKEFCS